jgi:hypothetical protein
MIFISTMATRLISAARTAAVRKTEVERSAIQYQRDGEGFQYTFALARTFGGLVGERKLDWFFVKGYTTDSEKPGGSYKFSPHFARTLQELNEAPDDPLSDHSPITVDIPLSEPPMSSTQK